MTVVKRVLKKKKNRCKKKLGEKNNEIMTITMCEKEYYFKLKNNNVCVLYIPTTNSKLEKFVQKQHSLWQLTGSSLGALRELVAVAGTLIKRQSFHV
jgi:hypothetical protein